MSRRIQYLKQGNHLMLMDASWVGAAEEPARKKEEPLEYKILPELKKLEILDQQEKQLWKRVQARQITEEVYENLMSAMDVQREGLVKKLEKKGYFQKEPVEQPDYHDNSVAVEKEPLTYEAKLAIGFVLFALAVAVKLVIVGP